FPSRYCDRKQNNIIGCRPLLGEVQERLNRPVSKTGVGVTPPWVRIPPSPPSFLCSKSIKKRPKTLQLTKTGKKTVCASPGYPYVQRRDKVPALTKSFN